IRQIGDPDTLELEPWELPTGEWGVTVTGEDVEYAGTFLYLSEDKKVAVGIERLLAPHGHAHRRDAVLPTVQRALQACARRALSAAGGRLLLLPARSRRRLGDRGDVRQALRHPFGGAAPVLAGLVAIQCRAISARVAIQTSGRPATSSRKRASARARP